MACTGANLAFYFTLREVAYIAMVFFHRRFKNLREVPILSLKNNSQQVFYLCN